MPTALAQQLRVTRILHLALMMSVVIYGAILAVLSQGKTFAGEVPTIDPSILLGIFAALAISNLAVVIPTLQKRLLPTRNRFGTDRLDLEDPAVAEDLLATLPKLRAPQIVTWALCDSVAIFGLVAAVMFHQVMYFVPFAAMSLLAFAYHAPTMKFYAAYTTRLTSRPLT